MIIVNVGEPTINNIGDVWFDPTTRITQEAQFLTSVLRIGWTPIQPASRPANPWVGQIYVDLIYGPAQFDGSGWIPAVPQNYVYPPNPPSPGDTWIESLSQTTYVFVGGRWNPLSVTYKSLIAPSVTAQPPVAQITSGSGGASLSINQQSFAHDIVIYGPNNTPMVTIHTDTGTIDYGSGYTPDAAAQIFWRSIAQASPRFLQVRIDELVKDLSEMVTRYAIAEGHILKFIEAGYKLPEPKKPFDPNDSWDRAMGVIK